MTGIFADLLQGFDPAQAALLFVIFLFAAIVKGFLGIGLPAASMAFLTLIMPPAEAIPLLWLSIFATNSLQFARSPNMMDIAREYYLFAVAIMVSIFVTSMFIADYPTALLTVAIGVAMVVFSLNLLLCVFNLIPLPPLDGAGVLHLFISEAAAQRVMNWMAQPWLAYGGLLIAWIAIRPIFRPIFE